MEVICLKDSGHLIETLYTACRTCYSSETPSTIYDKLFCHHRGYNCIEECPNNDSEEGCVKKSKEEMIELIDKVLSSGHYSVGRHCTFTFSINGISQALLRQLTRHHAGIDYSVQSTRYVNKKGFNYVKPKQLEDLDIINTNIYGDFTYDNLMELLQECYDNLIHQGFNKEDARMILPMCSTTNLLLTLNIEAFINLCKARLCVQAEDEIRTLVTKMVKAVSGYDFLLKYLKPNCKHCTDFRPCKNR